MTQKRTKGAMTLHRRTFEAKKFAKDSADRERLNLDPLTSEFNPSYKYLVREVALMSDGYPNPAQEFHNREFRTKLEAELYISLG